MISYPSPGPVASTVALIALLLTLQACAKDTAPTDAAPGDSNLRHHELAQWQARNAEQEGRFDQARIAWARALGEESPAGADAVDPEVTASHEKPQLLRSAGLAWMQGFQQSPTRALGYLLPYLRDHADDLRSQVTALRAWQILGEDREAHDQAQEILPLLSQEKTSEWAADASATRRAEAVWRVAEALADSQPEQARKLLRQGLEQHPQHAQLRAAAARVYQRLGDQDEALRLAREAIQLDPFDASSLYLAGRLLLTRQPEQAKELLATHTLVARLSGYGARARAAPSEELALLQELLPRVDANLPAFALRRLELLISSGRPDQARTQLEQLVGQDLEPRQQLTLARLALRLDEVETARQLLQTQTHDAPRAEARDPAENDAAWPVNLAREARRLLATLDLRQGNREGARQRLDDLLADNPHDASTLQLLARLHQQSEENELAAQRWRQALELAPWRPEPRIELARHLLATGQRQQASELLATAPEEHASLATFRSQHGLG